jgi:hypothetical protein
MKPDAREIGIPLAPHFFRIANEAVVAKSCARALKGDVVAVVSHAKGRQAGVLPVKAWANAGTAGRTLTHEAPKRRANEPGRTALKSIRTSHVATQACRQGAAQTRIEIITSWQSVLAQLCSANRESAVDDATGLTSVLLHITNELVTIVAIYPAILASFDSAASTAITFREHQAATGRGPTDWEIFG